LKEKLIKIGAKVVSHGRYVVFQMAEVAIPRQMFQEILRLIAELRSHHPRQPEAFNRFTIFNPIYREISFMTLGYPYYSLRDNPAVVRKRL
jgi:hypothetical protein